MRLLCAESDARNIESDSTSENGAFTIANMSSCHEMREEEAAAHIQQLSLPVVSTDVKRVSLQQRAAELPRLIEMASPAVLDIIESALSALKARIEAVRAASVCIESVLVETAQHMREPANKSVEPQRRFLSTKRRRLASSRNTLSKPSCNEQKTFSLNCCNRILFLRRMSCRDSETIVTPLLIALFFPCNL